MGIQSVTVVGGGIMGNGIAHVCASYYLEADDAHAGALAFTYRWTLKGGEVRRFDCVDIFRFEAGLIDKLTIIYDTALGTAHKYSGEDRRA